MKQLCTSPSWASLNINAGFPTSGPRVHSFIYKEVLICPSTHKSRKELPKQSSINFQALPSPSLENVDYQGSAIDKN